MTATVLTFPGRAASPPLCPTIRAANHAAAATHHLCEARRGLMRGLSAEAIGRALDDEGAVACLVIALRQTIELTGDQPRDRALREALDAWSAANGRTAP